MYSFRGHYGLILRALCTHSVHHDLCVAALQGKDTVEAGDDLRDTRLSHHTVMIDSLTLVLKLSGKHGEIVK
jgi:hypothetical protein